MTRIATGIILSCFLSISWATNQLREIEHANNIKSSFSIGKIVWLKLKNSQFLSLYTKTEKETQGAAIILHSMGGHPDQKKLINPLRTFLPQHSWATLSIQMPVLEMDANEKEYYPLFEDANTRIQAGIDFLIDDGTENIVIIGYGLGGMMAIYFINNKADKSAINALVTISLSVPDSDKKQAQVLDFIPKIEEPFFDIFAEFDLPNIVNSARKRRLSAKDNLTYRQLKIIAASHTFHNNEGLVVKRIYSWMNRTFK
jgi:predicted alpha/beta-fold hydrolase